MASLRPALSPQGFFALMVAKLKLAIAPNRFAFFGCGIADLCRKGEDTLLRMHDGRVFIFWESLDIAERQLDPALFCRVSRTFIINRKAANRWQRQTDRGLLLEVQPQNGEPVKVVRDKAAEVVGCYVLITLNDTSSTNDKDSVKVDFIRILFSMY